MRENLWPEPCAPFGEIESLFAETPGGWRVVRVEQGEEESRADFDQRVATLSTNFRQSTLLVCLVCEGKGVPCTCARCVPRGLP